MEDFDRQFVLIVPLAIGLLVMGTITLVAYRLALSWRVAASGGVVTALYGFLTTLLDVTNPLTYPLASLTATVVAVLLVQAANANLSLERLCKPVVYGSLMLAFGSGGLVGLYFYHEEESAAAQNRQTESLQLPSYMPERVAVEGVHAATDRGHPILLTHSQTPHSKAEMTKLEEDSPLGLKWRGATIKRHEADDNSNCHGWVFTGGRYIVPSQAVEPILHDNGYATVSVAAPGDLIVYRDAAGGITHTAVVRYTAPGRAPMVEGKWGWMGVYLHVADECRYGKNYTFHRSARDGDLLRGIDGASPVRFTGAE